MSAKIFNKSITLYCSYTKNKEIKYKRVVINGVFTDKSKIVNTNTTGMTDSNSVWVAIPMTAIKNYVQPKVFNKFPEKYMTLKEGDMLVDGIIDKDYNSMVQLQKEQDNVYTITGVDYKAFGSLPHFEVSGK